MGGVVRGYPLTVRLENAIAAYASYLSHAIWPTHLAFFYPHAGSFRAVWPDGLLLLAITVLALVNRNHRYLAFVAQELRPRARDAWRTDTDRRRPTKEALRCRLAVHETQIRARRMVVRATRSAPAHSAHQIRDADPSPLLQSRPWSRQEAGSLAKTLQQSTQQRWIGAALHTDHCSTGKLDVDLTARSRHNYFWVFLLVFRARYRDRPRAHAGHL